MPLPCIYADFNAIEYIDSERTKAEMALTGYGTLSSLARKSLRLEEGMVLILYEPNDIECEVTTHFDHARKDPAGRSGAWVARFDPRKIKDTLRPEERSKEYPCISCGQDFLAHPSKSLRNYTESCTHCGASVMEPMAAPGRAN